MKKFVQLMLHFHWLRSPWRRAKTFWYIPWSRKVLALLVNIGQAKEVKTIATKPLQRNHCNIVTAHNHCKEAIAFTTKSFQSDVVFMYVCV